jgi:hypothetical protein
MRTISEVTKFVVFEDLGKLKLRRAERGVQFEHDHQLHGGAVEQIRTRLVKWKVCDDVVLFRARGAHRFAPLLSVLSDGYELHDSVGLIVDVAGGDLTNRRFWSTCKARFWS